MYFHATFLIKFALFLLAGRVEELRKLSWSGIPKLVRPITWKLLSVSTSGFYDDGVCLSCIILLESPLLISITKECDQNNTVLFQFQGSIAIKE